MIKKCLVFASLIMMTSSQAAIMVNIASADNKSLPDIYGAPNGGFVEITGASAVVPANLTSPRVLVEAYVQIRDRGEIHCKLAPVSWLGRPVDPSQKTLEFMVKTPQAMGVNPPIIMGSDSVSRALTAKIADGVGGASYSIYCARGTYNTDVKVEHAYVKITATARD